MVAHGRPYAPVAAGINRLGGTTGTISYRYDQKGGFRPDAKGAQLKE
jgi:hypothetical protein